MTKRFSYILICFLISLIVSKADENIPSVYGQTSWGTEFFLTLPPNDGRSGDGKSIVLDITTIEENSLSVNIPFFNFSKNLNLEPNRTYQVDIPIEAAQPYLKALEENMDGIEKDGVYRNGRAIEVKSSKPVTISVTSKFGDYGDSYLALPLHVLGKRYTVSSYTTPETEYSFTDNLPSVVSIVATQDDSEVRFYLNGSSNSITTEAVGMGAFVMKKLNRGDVWVIGTKDLISDIGGSIVTSDKPVAVISGNQCAEVPLYNQFCDFMMNMEIPSHSWGSEYISLHNPGRKYGNIIRAFPLYDNTALYENGANVWNFAEANPSFAVSPLELTRDLSNIAPIYISSDKPFYAVEYSTGNSEDNRLGTIGGPSMQALMPVGENITDAYFNSSDNSDDDITGNDYLRVIYRKDSNGEIGFDIIILPEEIQKIDLDDPDIVVGKGDIDNSPFSYLVLKLPKNKTFRMIGDGITSLQKIGFNGKTGYSQPIYLTMTTNEFASDTIAPIVEYTQRCNGTISGRAIDMPLDEDTRSNVGANLMQNNINFRFIPDSKNDVPVLNFDLEPIDLSVNAYAELVFWDMRGNRSITPIRYTAPKIDVSKEVVDFGLSKQNIKLLDTVTITNLTEGLKIEYKEIRLSKGINFKIKETDKRPLKNSSIQPNDIRTIEIALDTHSDGILIDTIVIDRGCNILPIAIVKANVTGTEIKVSDKTIGDISQGDDYEFDIEVSNLSYLELTAHNAELTQNTVFSIIESRPTATEKWSLGPRSKRRISINVNSTIPGIYRDTLIVNSDATEGDSLGIISVNIKPPGLVLSSYDFGRRRINDTPVSGYIPNTGELTLSNRSNRNITLAKVELNSDEFEFTEGIENITVSPNQEIDLPLVYKPSSLGQHEAELIITDQSGQHSTSNLSGIGTCGVPNIESKNISKTVFGEIYRNTVTISNPDLTVSEFGDTLTIFNIAYNTLEESGLTIDRSSLPAKLAPGESMEIEVEYLPSENPSDFSISIDIESNGCNISNALLSGNFVEYITEITPVDPIKSCVNNTQPIDIEIINLSEYSVKYESVRLVPAIPEIRLSNPLLQQFELAPKENKIISVEFLSTESGTYTSTLQIVDEFGQNTEIDLNAESTIFTRYTTINRNDRISVNVGDTTYIPFGISEAVSGEGEISGELSLEISYDSSVFSPIEESVKLSNGIVNEGYFISQIENENGLLTINLLSQKFGIIDGRINDILEVPFMIYLPSGEIDSTISFSLSGSSICTEIIESEQSIGLIGCEIAYRGVKNYYGENLISAHNSESTIDISGNVAYGSDTQINIVDMAGNIVYSVMDGVHPGGDFSISINKTDLSNGSYFVVMTAAGEINTTKLILSE